MMKKYLLAMMCVWAAGCASVKMSEADKAGVIRELDVIFTTDQKFAGLPPDELVGKLGREEAWKVFLKMRDSVALDHQNRIKALYAKYGYLGYSKIGEKETGFWIVIQHADNDVAFQQKMLKALKKEIRKGNASRTNYAMLEDRVAVNTHQKQRFGSQVTYTPSGQAIPKNGLTDSVNVDKLRAEYHLPSFKEYYNIMTRRYYEMNKQRLNQPGIKEPRLYL